jgi:hypothetical protein
MAGILAWLHGPFIHGAQKVASPSIIDLVIVLEPVMRLLWWIRMLIAVAAMFTFSAWLYLSYGVVAQRGAHNRYRPGWVLGGFFVPIWNLLWPYLVVSEAWRAAARIRRQTEADEEPRALSTPLVVKLWWASMLVSVVVTAVGGEAVLPGYMTFPTVPIALHLLAAASGLFRQDRSGGTETAGLVRGPSAGLLGRWPLPVTATASALLTTLLILLGVYGYAGKEMRQFKEAGPWKQKQSPSPARHPQRSVVMASKPWLLRAACMWNGLPARAVDQWLQRLSPRRGRHGGEGQF